MRLDLDRIGARLLLLSGAERGPANEPVHSDVTRRLLEGYREVDGLLAEGVDLFGYGSSGRVLELNHIVLCGRSPGTRATAADHIAATEAHFYDARRGDFGGRVDWVARHRRLAPVPLAAGLFVECVASPQLFIEGNQRTATLLASWVLARGGHPPFVLVREDLRDSLRLFAAIRGLDRGSAFQVLRARRLARALAARIEAQADPALLLRPGPS